MKSWTHSGKYRTAAALVLLATLGAAALYSGTSGFRVISTEAGRRLDIAENPRALPVAHVVAAAGQPQPATLEQALRGDPRVAIVTFIYTQCNAMCSILGSELQQMQDALRQRGLQDKVRLISISFDPRDTPQLLASYAGKQKALPASWQFLAVPDARQRQQVLDTFGVVVLPAPLGEFEHNAAFHLVDKQGRLARVMDFTDGPGALNAALAMAGSAPVPTAASAAPRGPAAGGAP
ncbi:SCO family protein [Massilia sp. Root418]|uniref:SCO family protein n=1 Tax=Massilia sp. Root418 TaxID=1736532 RepID=UPI0009E724D8|nr:SCO family protein [Massilia sp. Root418]